MCILLCMHAGIAIIKCQGHEYSMGKRDTTTINLYARPDEAAQYKARNDPKVAAILSYFGVDKEEEYIYQGNRRIKKLVSYVLTATDMERTKYLIKKVAKLLPEFLDDDDIKLICSVVDAKLGYEKRDAKDCEDKNQPGVPGPPDEPTKEDREICVDVEIGNIRIRVKIRQHCPSGPQP